MDAPGLDAVGRFTSRRELATLAPHLEEGEDVHYALAGTFEKKEGLLAATNQRVLFATTGLLRDRVTSWPYGTLRQVTANVARDEAGLTLRTDDETLEVTGCEPRAAKAFAETVAKRSAKRAFRPVQIIADHAEARSAAEADMDAAERRLSRLDVMHEKGSITDEEWRSNRELLLKELGLPADLPAPRSIKDLSSRPPVETPWPETRKEKAEREAREAARSKGRRPKVS